MSRVPPLASGQRQLRALLWILLLAFVLVVLRHAWMMDDAFITLRTVDNLFAGLGPVWNPGERVQAYTHPLWLLLLCVAHALTGEFFFGPMLLGAAVSVCALGLVAVKLSRSQYVALVLVVAATLSNAFVDYSTSGLENPLTHLLIAAFAWVYLGQLPSARQFGLLCLIGGLSLLSRPDNGALLAPAVLWAGYEAYRRGTKLGALARAMLVGGIPLFSWELFSLFYYGALVPNTALAKFAGVPASECVVQGLFWVLSTIDLDPLTVVVVAVGVVLPLVTGQRRLLPLSLGIVLHLLYSISIGGDFMLGRFFTAPMFMALVCLSQLRRPNWVVLALLAGVFVVLGWATHPSTLEINSINPGEGNARTRRNVTDERKLLFDGFSLVKANRLPVPPRAVWWDRPNPTKNVDIAAVLGYRGLVAGPHVHWIDRTALSEPLLARLPALYNANWMSGHLRRPIPAGYLETLETGENVIKNKNIAELYRNIDLVVHGELWSRERFAAIWWLNTGGPNELITVESWQFKTAKKLEFGALRWRVDDRTALNDKRMHAFGHTGAYVKFGERQHIARVDVSLNGHARFELWLYDGSELIERVEVPMRLVYDKNSLMSREIELPEHVRERGFNRMRIVPRSLGKRFVLGHLLLDDAIETAPPLSERPPTGRANKAKNRGRGNRGKWLGVTPKATSAR